MSSTRLPGKVMMDIGGRPMIEQIVRRAEKAVNAEGVYVLTSTDPSDDVLVRFLESKGIECRRGPLGDVLERYLNLITETDADYVVRVTGDCPFVDPDFIDKQLITLESRMVDCVTIPEECEGIVGGQSAYTSSALRLARLSADPRDREHAGAFFFKRSKYVIRHSYELVHWAHRPDIRLQVDCEEDRVFADRIWRSVDYGEAEFPLQHVIALLDERPDLLKINRHIRESKDNQDLRAMK